MSDDTSLSDGLGRLGRQDWQVPEHGARAAMLAARRRNAARVGGLAAAVAVVAVGVPTVFAPEPVAAPVPPAATAPSPQPRDPAPEPSVVPAPSEAVPSDPVTASQVLQVVDGGDAPTRAGLLAGLRLAGIEPGGTYRDGAESGVVSGGTSWLADPCADGAASADEERTGFFAAAVPGDAALVLQAATYPDEASAASALGGLVDEVRRCPGSAGTEWREWPAGDDGLTRLVSYDVAGTGQDVDPQDGQQLVLGLDGDAVVLVAGSSIYIGTEIAYALGDTRPEVGPEGWADGTGEGVELRFAMWSAVWQDLRGAVEATLTGTVDPPTVDPPVVDPPVGPSPDYPADVDPVQGGRYWAVFVAVARDSPDARLEEAADRVRAAGLTPSVGDVACSQGAAETLGLDPARTYTATYVHFGSSQDAQQFVDAYPDGVVGTAEVTAYCLD